MPLKSVEGCDSTITLILKVISPTEVEIDDVKTLDLLLVPNPVNVGSTLFLNAEFLKQDIGNLLVEVFNTLGQNVLVFRPTNYPIEIKGLTQSGVYLVRITTSKREVYQGKFVVK